MNRSETLSGIRLVASRHNILLVDRALTDEERTLALEIDGIWRGELRMLRYYLPGMAVSHRHVIVWGGTLIYWTPLLGGPLSCMQQDDEIHAVYPIEEKWILVCETSVVFFDPLARAAIAVYEHNEVITRSWWSEEQLLVEDFEGRRLAFEPLAVGRALTPLSR